MKYLHQLLLIFLFSFLGELLHSLISWPIPASIYGMVLLFIALSLRIVKLEHIKTTGDAHDPLCSPRQYALAQQHKHLKEMKIC